MLFVDQYCEKRKNVWNLLQICIFLFLFFTEGKYCPREIRNESVSTLIQLPFKIMFVSWHNVDGEENRQVFFCPCQSPTGNCVKKFLSRIPTFCDTCCPHRWHRDDQFIATSPAGGSLSAGVRKRNLQQSKRRFYRFDSSCGAFVLVQVCLTWWQ